jgi:serine/threonine protein kinase
VLNPITLSFGETGRLRLSGVVIEPGTRRCRSPSMNRYSQSSLLGDGTYGSVWLATRADTGEQVAIKQ